MINAEINFQKSQEMSHLFELSDDELAACSGLGGSPTLAYASYCFTCRPLLRSGWRSTSLIKHQ
jgi:hypothetical protein